MLAARSVGVRKHAILSAHILPNSMSPVIVAGTLAMATAIIDVAGLGFLGLGPQDPATPEWGTMLTHADTYLGTAPFLAVFPGLAIVVVVLGFNLIGDGMREALDPKLRGRAYRCGHDPSRPMTPRAASKGPSRAVNSLTPASAIGAALSQNDSGGLPQKGTP